MSVLKPLNVIKQTNKLPSASVIFLHGSGDTGFGILKWVRFLVDLQSPHIRFLFPTAPVQPYTPMDGELSNVWFDRLDIKPDVPEVIESIEKIGNDIKTLINEEVALGVPLNRIVVGGFSMGGALALYTAYRFVNGLAGVFTLSSFMNKKSILYETPNLPDIPLYMCHGDRDTLVPIQWGQETYNSLKDLGANGEFVRIKNCMHELKKDELQGLLQWLNKVVPSTPGDNNS